MIAQASSSSLFLPFNEKEVLALLFHIKTVILAKDLVLDSWNEEGLKFATALDLNAKFSLVDGDFFYRDCQTGSY